MRRKDWGFKLEREKLRRDKKDCRHLSLRESSHFESDMLGRKERRREEGEEKEVFSISKGTHHVRARRDWEKETSRFDPKISLQRIFQ